MPVLAQNSAPPSSDITNQFVQVIGNIIKAGVDLIVRNFSSIARFFVDNILPPLVSILKSLFNAFFNKQ
jgi:hypothetical protein